MYVGGRDSKSILFYGWKHTAKLAAYYYTFPLALVAHTVTRNHNDDDDSKAEGLLRRSKLAKRW